jgi:hypothetical protein
MVPLPDRRGGIARTPVNPIPERFHVIRKGYGHPDAVFRMANLGSALLEGPDTDTYYHTDEESGDEIFFNAVITVGAVMDDKCAAVAALQESIRRKTWNPEGGKRIWKRYFEKCMAWLDGDKTGWPYWMTFVRRGA